MFRFSDPLLFILFVAVDFVKKARIYDCFVVFVDGGMFKKSLSTVYTTYL